MMKTIMKIDEQSESMMQKLCFKTTDKGTRHEDTRTGTSRI